MDVVETSPYEKGLMYEKKLQALKNGKRLKADLKLNFEKLTSTGDFSVNTDLKGLFEEEISEFTIIAKRAESKDFDVSVELKPETDNHSQYFAKLNLPREGLWLVDVKIISGDKTYMWDKKVYL